MMYGPWLTNVPLTLAMALAAVHVTIGHQEDVTTFTNNNVILHIVTTAPAALVKATVTVIATVKPA